MTRSDLKDRSTWTLLAAFGIVVAMFGYSFRLVRVRGISMEPNYHSGQWLLVRRGNFPAFPLGRGEVIVFRIDGDVLVKRIAALPGDVPPVEDLRLLRFLNRNGGNRESEFTHQVARLFAPVPKDHLYVLGDNAPVSDDSRSFGPIPTSAVIGRVIQWAPPDAPEHELINSFADGSPHPHPVAHPVAHQVVASVPHSRR